MKSEHRHELKTNELADWMAHFPEWAQKNSRNLTIGAAIIVVVAGAIFWMNYNKNVRAVAERIRFSNLLAQLPQAKEGILTGNVQDASLALTQVSTSLDNYASKSDNKTMSALAYLKCAEAQRAELHLSSTPINPADLPAKIESAQKNYRMAEQKATNAPSIRAAARYGLGLCLEELKQFTEAEAQYQAIVADETLAGTAGRTAAEDRLQVLPSYQQGVTFRPAPEPEPETLVPTLTEGDAAPVAGPALPAEVADEPSDANTTEG